VRIAFRRQIEAVDARSEAERRPGYDLIERAGALLAKAVSEEAQKVVRRDVILYCGPGKNGADGYRAALALKNAGYETLCVAPGGEVRNREAGAAAALYLAAGGRIVSSISAETAEKAGLLVDALFGTGLSRPLEGAYALAVEKMNLSGRPVIAADLPSGIEADSGRILGTAVRADRTVTFTLPKPAHYLAHSMVGELTVADIGIPEDILSSCGPYPMAFDGDSARILLPRRADDTHKGQYGKAVLFAGGKAYSGAASLAARAAVRSGAGLVWACVPRAVYPAVAAAAHEAITFPLADYPDGSIAYPALSDPRLLKIISDADSFAAGSGLIPGPGAKRLLRVLIRNKKKLVLDAGMLNFLSSSQRDGSDARILFEDEPLHENVILTPHRGELARIFGGDPAEEDENPLALASRVSVASGAVVVLKGHRTVTAAPDGRIALNTTGNPGMARGGSGDALAGTIAGLAARMGAFEAAALGVWLNGRAGDLARDRIGETGMTPEDVIGFLGEAARSAGKAPVL